MHSVSVSARKVLAIITVAEKPLASQEGLRSLALINAMIHTHVITNTTREISYIILKYVTDNIHYLILSSCGWCLPDF